MHKRRLMGRGSIFGEGPRSERGDCFDRGWWAGPPTLHFWLSIDPVGRVMSMYRRVRIDGARYFFTVALSDRRRADLIDQIDLLREAYQATAAEQPFSTDAIVVLPDHIHAVWTLPPGDADFSNRWRKIKARFSHAIGERRQRSMSKVAKRECGIWQRRFWEHAIRDDHDWRMHVRYCWGNPVKHGYVERAADWPYSSIHRDIRMGRVEPEWAGSVPEGEFGE